MDFIAFLTTWFWYIVAFCVGGLLAWLAARQFIPAQTPREAIEHALADRDEDDHADRDDRSGRDDHDHDRYDERDGYDAHDDERVHDAYPVEEHHDGDDFGDERPDRGGRGATSASEVRR